MVGGDICFTVAFLFYIAAPRVGLLLEISWYNVLVLLQVGGKDFEASIPLSSNHHHKIYHPLLNTAYLRGSQLYPWWFSLLG
jgi:hypothetical protein